MDTATLESNFAFSGSLDGEIRSWRLGSLQLMLYEAFDPSIAGPVLSGHTNAVWSVAVRVSGSISACIVLGYYSLSQLELFAEVSYRRENM